MANKCSLRTKVQQVADPPQIHQNSLLRVRRRGGGGELFECTGLRQEYPYSDTNCTFTTRVKWKILKETYKIQTYPRVK